MEGKEQWLQCPLSGATPFSLRVLNPAITVSGSFIQTQRHATGEKDLSVLVDKELNMAQHSYSPESQLHHRLHQMKHGQKVKDNTKLRGVAGPPECSTGWKDGQRTA